MSMAAGECDNGFYGLKIIHIQDGVLRVSCCCISCHRERKKKKERKKKANLSEIKNHC